MSPYEKRLLDMLKVSGASADKRMYKFAKRRVRFAMQMVIFLFINICSWDLTREHSRSVTRLRKCTPRSEPELPEIKRLINFKQWCSASVCILIRCPAVPN